MTTKRPHEELLKLLFKMAIGYIICNDSCAIFLDFTLPLLSQHGLNGTTVLLFLHQW